MTTNTSIVRVGAALAAGAVLLPSLAFAQAGVAGSVSATAQTNAAVNTPVAQTGAAATANVALDAKATAAQDKANQEIDRRIAALNELTARINQMTRVSDTLKQGLTSNTQGQVGLLTTLKAKIDSDTDMTTLKTDIQSITTGYRTYALVMPQGRISAGADRVANVTTMMQAVGMKIQARLQAAQAAGSDITAEVKVLTDLGAKITDANTQAQASINVIAPLAPDNGDKTVKAANDKALKTAQADLRAAQADLVAARKDIDTLIKGLGTLKPSAAATTTTTTTTNTGTPAQ
jgi:hypothetical protein